MSTPLPPIGTYWTSGAIETALPMHKEAYSTCARCGAFVNSPDRHEDWHREIETRPTPEGDPR